MYNCFVTFVCICNKTNCVTQCLSVIILENYPDNKLTTNELTEFTSPIEVVVIGLVMVQPLSYTTENINIHQVYNDTIQHLLK